MDLVELGRIAKGLPSSLKDAKKYHDVPKSLRTKWTAHHTGKEISQKVASGHYKGWDNHPNGRVYPVDYGGKLFRRDVGGARISSSAPTNVDVIAGKRKGKLESSLAAQRGQAYRNERLRRTGG